MVHTVITDDQASMFGEPENNVIGLGFVVSDVDIILKGLSEI